MRRLKRRAARHRRSLEEEIREILRHAVKDEARRTHEFRKEGLGTRIARRFAGIGLTEEIPEWRGELARPAKFDIRVINPWEET